MFTVLCSTSPIRICEIRDIRRAEDTWPTSSFTTRRSHYSALPRPAAPEWLLKRDYQVVVVCHHLGGRAESQSPSEPRPGEGRALHSAPQGGQGTSLCP